jgi:hypothetical protein
MKRCLICNEFKVLTDFHVATDKPDGRRNDCKLCRKNKIKRNFNPLDKFCNHCKLFKPNNEKHFFKSSHKKTKSKFRAECKDCHRTRMKNYTLEERYGLSIEKYNELKVKYEGRTMKDYRDAKKIFLGSYENCNFPI